MYHANTLLNLALNFNTYIQIVSFTYSLGVFSKEYYFVFKYDKLQLKHFVTHFLIL